MTSAVESSRNVLRRHSRSFSLAQRLLPASARDSGAVVYAWCRRADDFVDELPLSEATPALARLEHELDQVYAGVPQIDPLLEAFRQVVTTHGIPKQYPSELLAGLHMDIQGKLYATPLELYLYCYRVAGTVGLMMCHVMGVRDPRALSHAAHLGMAMQLTNICRDVVEDWRRARLYVPLSLLGARPPPRDASGEFPAPLVRPMARAVERLLSEADRLYASGDQGLRYLSPRSMWAVLVARLVYSSIGKVLRVRGCDVTSGRAYVSLAEKLWLTSQGLARVIVRLPSWLVARRAETHQLPVLEYPADVLPG